MVKLSVVIIAKNEEQNIARCINSVKWADEVIVVDGISSDKTAAIAKSLGAKVIEHPFTGSFADDRNIGMDNARNDWILQLDADDVVTENLRLEFERALSVKNDIAVYKFRRRNFFLGHSMDHGGWHHYIPNLVNKKFTRFIGAVHERPDYKGAVGVIDADIEHYPFDSIHRFIERQNRYTDIAAERLLKEKGILKESEITKQLIFKTFGIFWKSYMKKRGYKEGFYGFLFAVLFASINFIKWAKYWEMTRQR